MLKAILGYQIKNDGKSDGKKMLLAEKSSFRDNGLQVPLMIEWE